MFTSKNDIVTEKTNYNLPGTEGGLESGTGSAVTVTSGVSGFFASGSAVIS